MDYSEESRARTTDTVPPAARPRKGAALVEYALILSLVSVLAVGSLALVGGQANAVFASVASALDGPHDNGCHGQAGCHDNNGGGNGGNPGGGNGGGQRGGKGSGK